MRKLERFGAMAVAVVMVAVLALPVMAAGGVTVGQFIQRLAMAKNLNATDARVAADSLAIAGYRLPAGLDFSARLTEGQVAGLANAMGLKVRTAKPDASFDQGNVDRFFKSFRYELEKPGATGSADDIRLQKIPGHQDEGHGKGKGKGKGKGPGETPHAPH